MTGTSPSSRARTRSYIGQLIVRASPGGSSGSLQPNSSPPSSSRQYSPSPMSKTIGERSTSNASWGSSTQTVWRAAPAGIRRPASRPTDRSDGPPVRSTRSVAIGPADVSTPTTRRPPAAGSSSSPVNAVRSRSSTPACLHRERVGADVPRRVDAAVRLDVAAAAVAVGRERRDERRRLGGRQPADGEALAPLHRDPLAAGPLVVLGDGEDEVAELAEAGVGPDRRLLAVVEVDRPAAERDGRRRPALGPDDARRARARALADEPLLERRRPGRARRVFAKYDAQPPTRPRADDDEIGAIGRGHDAEDTRRRGPRPTPVSRSRPERAASAPQPSSGSGLDADRDDAQPLEARVRRRGVRTVQAATSSPAARARANDPGVDRPPIHRDAAAARVGWPSRSSRGAGRRC